jgi:hypothetical protein
MEIRPATASTTFAPLSVRPKLRIRNISFRYDAFSLALKFTALGIFVCQAYIKTRLIH